MKVYLTSKHVVILKRHLKQALPEVRSSYRIQAAARGLGFNTLGGLTNALKNAPVSTDFDDRAFRDFLIRRDHDVEARALRDAVIRTVLEPIVAGVWNLSTWGYGLRESYPPNQNYRAALAADQAELFDDIHCKQFELALVFLQRAKKRNSLNRRVTSNQLKHDAENVSREFGLYPHLGNWVKNGVFIAAAIYEGFEVKRRAWNSLDAYLNISSKSRSLFKDEFAVRSLLDRSDIAG